MIKFLCKLVILWEKKKFLTLLEMENGYLKGANSTILDRNVVMLRENLGKLNTKNKRTNLEEKQIVTLNKEIDETEKFRQMIESGEFKMRDLQNQIKEYKQKLWN